MDIVHLMETSTESLQERISHSYAEIEQTIALDHSEGQTACVCMRGYKWLIQAMGPTIFLFRRVAYGLWSYILLLTTLRLPCPFLGAQNCSYFVVSSLSQSSWAAPTKNHGSLNNRNLFLLVLKNGSSRSGWYHIQGLVRALFIVVHGCLLALSSHQGQLAL